MDLTLEQTVNKNAASRTRGITSFSNSHGAFRRWSITLTQRNMALTDLCELVSLPKGEEPVNQLRKWRIKRDNADMIVISKTVNNTSNPFADHSPADLVNVSSGRAANEATKRYLLETLNRGNKLRMQFEKECEEDESRSLQPVAKTKVLNFAAENVKSSKSAVRKLEGVRDVFCKEIRRT